VKAGICILRNEGMADRLVCAGLYNKKENWMPWIEDQYLKWFTNDNKASYATKGWSLYS